MIRVSEILSNFYGSGKTVVGLRQPLTPDYSVLDAVNTFSLSGQYYDSGLINAENIKDLQNYPDISDANFNIYVGNLIKDSLINAINLVFTDNAKLESGIVYKNVMYKKEALTLPSAFVGIEINMLQNENISATINNVATEFEGTGTITLYLFSSEQKAPIQTKSISVTDGKAEQTALDWKLDMHKNIGGNYYLGYLTDGLAIKPYSRNCGNSYFRTQFKNVLVRPAKVTGHNTETIFDIEDVDYSNETYGLNLDISVEQDYTNYIIDNKLSFVELFRLQFQADVLKMFISSTRSNEDERHIIKRAVRELEGVLTEQGNVYSQGILRKLENEAKNVYKNYINREKEMTIGSAL